MGDAISDDEKRQLVHQLLLQTPPGEFNATFNDVRILVDNDNIMKQCGKTYMDYFLEQHTPVLVSGEETVALSREGRLPDGNFLAPNTKKVFSFDPMKKEATVVGDYSGPLEHESLRTVIREKLGDYIKNHYLEGVETVLARTNAETNKPEIIIVIESHSFMQNNFHTGNWREAWNLSVDESSGSARLKGTIKVQVHYYEEGNVQQVSRKDVESSFKFSSDESLADEVVRVLEELTNSYQRAIMEMYGNTFTHTFKSLRRALPITHSKMNWEQIASLKIGAELKNIKA